MFAGCGPTINRRVISRATRSPGFRSNRLGLAPERHRRPLFPRDRSAQPVAVLQMLENHGTPLGMLDLALAFRERVKDIDRKIASAVLTLARYGRITVLADGRYLARRAA